MDEQSLALALFSFGGLLLLVGVIGGNFKALSSEIPRVGIVPRVAAALLSPLFFIGSITVWATAAAQHELDRPIATAPPAPLVTHAEPLEAPLVTHAEPLEASSAVPIASAVVTRLAMVLADSDLSLGFVGSEVTLTIDGIKRGTLYVDLNRRIAATDVHLDGPGVHEYSFHSTLSLADGTTRSFESKGTFDVSDRAIFGLLFDESGHMGLARTGSF